MPDSLVLYQPGDRLHIYRPGETVYRGHPSFSLLLFEIDELDFSGYGKATTTRIKNWLKNDNRVHVGDATKETRASFRRAWESISYGVGPGERSMYVFEEVLGRAGLCYGLKADGWPPDNIDGLRNMLPEYTGEDTYYGRPRTYHYRSVAEYLARVER